MESRASTVEPGNLTIFAHAEEELIQFKTIADCANYGVAISDLDGNLTYVNEYFSKTHGYSADELIGKHLSVVHNEEQLDRVKTLITQLIHTGNFVNQEVWHKRKDGTTFPTLMSATVIKSKEGKPQFLSTTALDLTELKKSEREIKEAREFLESIFHASADGILVTNSNGFITAANNTLEAMFGYAHGELIGKPASILGPKGEDSKKRSIEMMQKVFDEGVLYGFEHSWLRKDGSLVRVEINTALLKDEKRTIKGAVNSIRDITYRKQVEQELIKTNDHLDNIIESSLDCIVVVDHTGKIKRANKSFQKLLGYEEDEFLGKPMALFLPHYKATYESLTGQPIDINDDFFIGVQTKIAQFLKEGTLYNWETYFIRHDKKLISIEANLSMLRDDKEKVAGGVAILRDISDRRHEEDMLESVNQCLLSFSPDPDENIKNIIETAGLVLGSICTLYNKEDGPFLCTVEGWNIPKDLKRKDRKEGHICYDIMTKSQRDAPCIINDLDRSPYATTDPNVAKYKLKTYVGCVVKKNTQIIGTLCVVYQEHKTLSANELNILSILAKALGVEEERKEALRTLQEHQQRLIISEENLREFSRKILSVREEEKKRLSRSLHDEIGSMTIAIGSHLSITEEEITDHNLERALENLTHTKTALAQSVQRLKKLCIDLRPPALDIAGLPNILKKHCATISKHEGMPIEFRVDGNETQLSDEVVTVLYRITQEALNNVIKHASAKKVTADLHFQGEAIKLTIKDDGKGFEVEKKLKKSKGLGLIGMRERIESLGGVFTITSAIKKGTEITVSVPH